MKGVSNHHACFGVLLQKWTISGKGFWVDRSSPSAKPPFLILSCVNSPIALNHEGENLFFEEANSLTRRNVIGTGVKREKFMTFQMVSCPQLTI